MPRPGITDLPQHVADEAVDLYRTLAVGRATDPASPLPTFRPDNWDLRIEGILVELDEERHFNRYRLETLAVSAYEDLPAFPRVTYRAFCSAHEPDCLASAGYGGYWMNPSCVAMFGEPGPMGDLTGNGAPRWKQRAFYDHLKDLAPLCGLGPMARLAVWDRIPGIDDVVLGDAVNAESLDRGVARGVVRLIRERAHQ